MSIQQAHEPYAPYRFTVEDYYRMADSEILTEDNHVELIGGQILVKEPAGPQHAGHVDFLCSHLRRLLEDRALIRQEHALAIDELNHPEPDLTVVKPREDFYRTAHPRSEDVLLVIEVAYTSARADRKIKVPLYARAGIPEFWLIDLPGQRLEVYREPAAGGYRVFRRLDRTSFVTPMAFPDVRIAVSDIIWPLK